MEGPIEVDGNRYVLAFLPYNTRNAENWSVRTAEALGAQSRVVVTERQGR